MNLDNKEFAISDYLEYLEPSHKKERNKYICPNCGGHNLSINRDGIKYDCYNCSDRSAIAKILLEKAGHLYNQSSRSFPKSTRPRGATKPGSSKVNRQLTNQMVRCSSLPPLVTYTNIDTHRDIGINRLFLRPKRVPHQATEQIYPYRYCKWSDVDNLTLSEEDDWLDSLISQSKPAYVVRYDYSVEEEKNKTFSQWHHDDAGSLVNGKGDYYWLPYRFTNIIRHGERKTLIGVEGEKCVDVLAQYGLFATTWQGSSWDEKNLATGLRLLKASGYELFAYFADNDGVGRTKAQAIEQASALVKLPCVIIPMTLLWDKCPEHGDIVDYLEANPKMNRDDFIKRLEKEIHRAVEMRTQPAHQDDPLKLDISAYLQTSELFDKVQRKTEICSHYGIKAKDFDLLCQHLEKQQSTPEKTVFSFDEFFERESDAIRWLIPGLLPVGETILLAALAKTGKTLLALEIAYAVLSGSRVIGENCEAQGKVLFISSDESAGSTRRRLEARGFDLLEQRQNLQIMTSLDLSDLCLLEQQLEDFRPTLVIIDSLTSITGNLGISENNAEFAQHIYKLKNLLGRYGATGILIHHENKDKDAKGINKVSGSARIPAATWAIWQLKAASPDNEQNTKLWLTVKPREAETITLGLALNPKDLWISEGIFSFVEELGDKKGDKKTQGEEVLKLLKTSPSKEFKFTEIDQYLNIGRGLYQVLDRLEDRQLITKRRSEDDRRCWVYSLPEFIQQSNQTEGGGGNLIPLEGQKQHTPPSPNLFSGSVEQTDENITGQRLQEFNSYSTNEPNYSTNYSTPSFTQQNNVGSSEFKPDMVGSASQIGDRVITPSGKQGIVIEIELDNLDAVIKLDNGQLIYWPITQLKKLHT